MFNTFDVECVNYMLNGYIKSWLSVIQAESAVIQMVMFCAECLDRLDEQSKQELNNA
jgi:hypothetical protein